MVLIVRMKAPQGLFQADVFHQESALAGIFAQHNVHRIQSLDGAQGDVVQVANGSRHEVERYSLAQYVAFRLFHAQSYSKFQATLLKRAYQWPWPACGLFQ